MLILSKPIIFITIFIDDILLKFKFIRNVEEEK